MPQIVQYPLEQQLAQAIEKKGMERPASTAFLIVQFAVINQINPVITWKETDIEDKLKRKLQMLVKGQLMTAPQLPREITSGASFSSYESLSGYQP